MKPINRSNEVFLPSALAAIHTVSGGFPRNINNVAVAYVLYAIKRAYNPELVELKQQARIHYQTWLRLKDIDNKTAQAAYFEYLDIKRKIELMQVPF